MVLDVVRIGVGLTKEQIRTASYQAGYEVMAAVYSGRTGVEYPRIWIGGESGALRRYGDALMYAPYDLAQSLKACRTGMDRAIERGTAMQFQKQNAYEGTRNRSFELLRPTKFDRDCLVYTMWGADSAVRSGNKTYSAHQARLVFQKFLTPKMINEVFRT